MSIRRILVPIDFSTRSAPALEYAFGLAKLAGAEVDEVFLARQGLQTTVDRCARRGIVPTLNVETGDIASGIVRFAAESEIDLIVLATRGHRGAAEMLLGSVSHKVITCAGCPVVTIGEHAAHSRSLEA